jgi:glutamate dehydrogenase
LGGSLGRDAATGRGGFYLLEKLREQLGLERAETRVIVQGFGNVGRWLAELAHEAGYRIVGLSDSKGGRLDPQGLDPKKFKELEHPLSQEELLTSECDVLVPAALENQITLEVATKLKCKAVLELANGPTTPEADEKLEKRGIVVIPDVLANAGGVTVSYFEWVQNLTREEWTEDTVNQKLKAKMLKAWTSVRETKTKHGGSWREAAFILAINRLVEAMKARGI